MPSQEEQHQNLLQVLHDLEKSQHKLSSQLERLRPLRNWIAHGEVKVSAHAAAELLQSFSLVEKTMQEVSTKRQLLVRDLAGGEHQAGIIEPAVLRLRSGLPKFWELFSFILPSKTRRECFDPAYNDLLEDYVRARKFHGQWARRWLAIAFTLRTLFMVADCFRVLLQSGTGRILLGLLPGHLRSWWRRQ